MPRSASGPAPTGTRPEPGPEPVPELVPGLPSVAASVVGWSDAHLRDLPWRRCRDPWAILVAEIMLQQTQVARVVDRWEPFLARFPDAASCADAGSAEVQRAWRGLGYNRRALMLHRAAVVIVDHHGGLVPDRLDDLLDLPGIGPYTARAVRAFAFEEPAAPVDTNIARVLARMAGRSLRAREAQALADALVPGDHVWRYNQAVMELGALVCTKRAPGCDRCPLGDACRWRGQGGDPALGSAGVPGPQSRFEGSDRQLRGRLVEGLRRAPLRRVDVVGFLGCEDVVRVDRVVAGLIADGLVESRPEEMIGLAGERVSRDRSEN